MEEAGASRVDGRVDVRADSQRAGGPRTPVPGPAAGLPGQRAGAGDDLARSGGVHDGGASRFVPSTLEHRTRFTFDQDSDADGYLAVQDTGNGEEGGVDPLIGLQSDPRCDGGGGRGAQPTAA